MAYLSIATNLSRCSENLDREENATARGFYLTAWNGTSGYAFDRISRGNTHVDGVCVSLLGTTQPGRASGYIRRAIAGGAADDGLIQRFGLLTWPDQDGSWREVDRFPDFAARQEAWATFEYLAELDPDRIGAERDSFETVPFLHFDNEAQGIFSEWHAGLEKNSAAESGIRPLKSFRQVSEASSVTRPSKSPFGPR